MIRKVYVSLDSLLDTELGLMVQNASKKQLKRFVEQRKDSMLVWPAVRLGLIKQGVWDDWWTTRDVYALATAPATQMPIYINGLVSLNEIHSLPDIKSQGLWEVHVDLYPYELHDQEIEIIANALFLKFGSTVICKFINVGELELNRDKLSMYREVIIKDVNNWLHFHGKALMEKPLPNVNVSAPLLYNKTIADYKEEVLNDVDVVHEFARANSPERIVQNFMAEAINLKFIEPLYYMA